MKIGAVEPFANRTIKHLLEARAASTPDRKLVTIRDGTYTAGALNDAVNRVARGLQRIGIGAGVTVAILSSNRSEMIVVWLALAKIGAVSVPINVSLKAPQIAHVLGDSGSRVLVAEGQWLPEVLRIEERLPRLEQIVLLDPIATSRDLGRQAIQFADLDAGPADNPSIAVQPADLASIIYTGGTTGRSKGVMCCQSYYYWRARMLSGAIGLIDTDVWYTCLPLFHANAQSTLLSAVLVGSLVALGERFSAGRYWDETRACGATIASLLGTMAHMLYHREPPGPRDRQERLRTIFCPALPAALQPDFERRFGVRVRNAYGSTELPCITMTPAEGPSRPGSMGLALDGFELKVVDERDCDVPDGAPGELVVRPREPFSVMVGYFRMPEETAEAWRNLWFHTGDCVYRDADGHFYFLDRFKDSIRRRGENVASFEVEQVVNAHAAVLESAAYPVPADIGEDEVMISVVARPGQTLDVAGLIEWCEARLPRFAVPRFVDVVGDLPKTAVGRVEKFKLRARGVTVDTWDRERERVPKLRS